MRFVLAFKALITGLAVGLALTFLFVPGRAAMVQAPLGASGVSFEPDYEILINLPGFRLYLYRDGTIERSYPIGIGQAVSHTLLGQTSIINKVVNPTYYPPNWYQKGLKPIPPGPDNPVGTRWLGLGFSGYGIHGTDNPQSIGKPVSGGCIRMRNADVEELASLVPVGTPVRFVYETVLIDRDMFSGNAYLISYPDIYDRGTKSSDQVVEALREVGGAGFVPVHEGALRHILEAAESRWFPVPARVEVSLNGVMIGYGFRYATDIMVPLDAILALACRERTGLPEPTVQIDGVSFVPLSSLMRTMGLDARASEDAMGNVTSVELYEIETGALYHSAPD